MFSILFQGSLLPFVARKLGMIDTKADVMKTFNDYAEEVPVQFIQVDIPKEHMAGYIEQRVHQHREEEQACAV